LDLVTLNMRTLNMSLLASSYLLSQFRSLFTFVAKATKRLGFKVNLSVISTKIKFQLLQYWVEYL